MMPNAFPRGHHHPGKCGPIRAASFDPDSERFTLNHVEHRDPFG